MAISPENKKELMKAVKVLNESGLLEEEITVSGKMTYDDIRELFLDAVESIDEEKQDEIPESISELNNKLIEEEEKEAKGEPDKKEKVPKAKKEEQEEEEEEKEGSPVKKPEKKSKKAKEEKEEKTLAKKAKEKPVEKKADKKEKEPKVKKEKKEKKVRAPKNKWGHREGSIGDAIDTEIIGKKKKVMDVAKRVGETFKKSEKRMARKIFAQCKKLILKNPKEIKTIIITLVGNPENDTVEVITNGGKK